MKEGVWTRHSLLENTSWSLHLCFQPCLFPMNGTGDRRIFWYIPQFLTSLCLRKRRSLSVVPVCHSGYLLLIFSRSVCTCRTVTLYIGSMNVTRSLRSTTTSNIPIPLLPETMKSNSASPTLSLSLLLLGRLSMKVLSSSVPAVLFVVLPFFFVPSCASTALPCIDLMYR